MSFGVEFKKIKMPEPIYSSEQTEGLSYSYFMILLPEGTFYHNCAVIVAFIKEEKRREIILLRQCLISDDGSHTPWELGVRQGHENPQRCPWHWVASAAQRWCSPLNHCICLNGKDGWWIWAAPWWNFILQIGSSRGGARLTAQSPSSCPEYGCGCWAAITQQLCVSVSLGGQWDRKYHFFFSE